jgi:hypothetical protein
MEFEKDAPVSDDQRRLAETKKVTVQPVHIGVAPDDVSNSDIANSHINGQPIANVYTDIEQDAPMLQQAHTTTRQESPSDHKKSAIMMATILGVASVLLVASLFFVYSIIA